MTWGYTIRHTIKMVARGILRLLPMFSPGLVLIVIAVLSLVPGNERPHVFSSGKLEHFVAYALAAAIISIGMNRPLHLLAVVIMLPLYAGTLEFA